MRKLKRHLDITTSIIHDFLTEYNYNEGDFDAEQVTTRLIKTIKNKNYGRTSIIATRNHSKKIL